MGHFSSKVRIVDFFVAVLLEPVAAFVTVSHWAVSYFVAFFFFRNFDGSCTEGVKTLAGFLDSFCIGKLFGWSGEGAFFIMLHNASCGFFRGGQVVLVKSVGNDGIAFEHMVGMCLFMRMLAMVVLVGADRRGGHCKSEDGDAKGVDHGVWFHFGIWFLVVGFCIDASDEGESLEFTFYLLHGAE